jgi:peroxin-13
MLGGGYGSSYSPYGSSMYGGGYGSFGGGYGGYGGYGSSFGGMYPSIGAGLYQVIDAINMIDQTFFALTNVAEQFRHMGNVLTSLLGIYALKDFIKRMLKKILGIKTKFNIQEFQKFQALDNKNANKSRFRIWPILVFIGLPLLISKLISGLQKQHQEQIAQQQQAQQQAQQLPHSAASPASVQFAKALYEFTPENTQIEIPLEVGEIIAILEDKGGWSRIRKRKGEMGWVPTNYLEIIKRNANV